MPENRRPGAGVTVLRTEDVDRAERLGFWTGAISSTYVDLDCVVPGDGDDIRGRIDTHDIADLGLSRVASTPQHVIRTPGGIARACDDYFLVSVQVGGAGMLVQDERTAVLGPGDFALYDTTRPYQLLFDDEFVQYVLMLPGASLRTVVRNASDLTARTVSGGRGAGRLLATMIETIMNDDKVGSSSAEAVATSIEYLLIAGLADLAGEEGGHALGAAERLERIKTAILFRLSDPDLSVASLAAQLHMSVSSIHRAFARESATPAEWIWSQRLDAVRADLEDADHRHQTIGYLASRWGFTDSAHFSRAFKNRYGCTPRQFRVRHLD